MKSREKLPIILDLEDLETIDHLEGASYRARLRQRADEILAEGRRRAKRARQLQVLIDYDPDYIDA